MDLFTFTMTISLIIALSFLAWLYTKPGKKWLENLKRLFLLAAFYYSSWQAAAQEGEMGNCPKARECLTRWCLREIPTAS